MSIGDREELDECRRRASYPAGGARQPKSFRDVLLGEIDRQRKLQDRMGDFHESTQGNGIMGQIRAERLALLNKLLEFETSQYSGGAEHG